MCDIELPLLFIDVLDVSIYFRISQRTCNSRRQPDRAGGYCFHQSESSGRRRQRRSARKFSHRPASFANSFSKIFEHSYIFVLLDTIQRMACFKKLLNFLILPFHKIEVLVTFNST